jgi:ABC-type phosphate transport system substrate-binding protein
MTANPAVSITVNGGGSTHGVEFVGRGLIDIGTSSHGPKQSERDEYPDLQVYTIARFALAIVTHPGVGVTELSEIEGA